MIERDLTRDGKPDLILSHEGLNCQTHGRSSACGMQACLVRFYVRRGALLTEQSHVLSVGVSLGEDNPPTIRLLSHDFGEWRLRWNGHAFARQ